MGRDGFSQVRSRFRQRSGPRFRARASGAVTVAAVLVLFATLLAASVSLGSRVPASSAGSDAGPTNPARPFVTGTIPGNDEMAVPLYSWIVAQFSEPMNTSNMLVRTQPEIALTWVWMNRNATLLLTHEEDLAPCTTYWVFVDGADLQGQHLLVFGDSPVVPDPWTFTTACSVFTITRTDPVDGQTNVAVSAENQNAEGGIVIWFSRPANPATLQVTLTPSVELVPRWSNGNAKVVLYHETWFYDCALHTITVSARDANGSPLTNVTGSAPNPWTFTTVCLSPMIVRTSPANAAMGVPLGAPIVVTFSTRMNESTVTWSLDPPSPSPFTPEWTNGGRILTLTHAVPFWKATTYTVTVAGKDWHDEDLAPGPVPNPWSFTTADRVSPPAGLHVARSPPDIVLSWRGVPGAISYLVYSSPDRFAPWPWPLRAEVSETSYVHAGAYADGTPHFYVVRARDFENSLSGNSSMGVKYSIAFAFDPGRANVHWISLPYRSPYRFAKDISDELTAAKVGVVAKWNPATQSPSLWYFFRGAWRGTNFPIAPGDGLYVGVVSSFTWVVNGTDGAVAHTFTRYPPPNVNVHWVSLPYTSVYGRASDLVRDIEGDTGPTANVRIVEVGKWDALRRTTVVFYWTVAGWSGTDFPIAPSDGVYVRVVSSFAWTPRLLIPEVP